MREPDARAAGGSFEAWHVPIDRVARWVAEHEERVHQASRGLKFARTWRDLWYLRMYVSGGDIDDAFAVRRWAALSLRDLRVAPPEFPRIYLEAEWELFAEWIDDDPPPVNGDGLYEQRDEPVLIYQFHGLPEKRVLNVTDDPSQPLSFASYALELLALGPGGEDWRNAVKLSALVNAVRDRDGLRPLAIGQGNAITGDGGTGLLVELESGASISLPMEVIPQR